MNMTMNTHTTQHAEMVGGPYDGEMWAIPAGRRYLRFYEQPELHWDGPPLEPITVIQYRVPIRDGRLWWYERERI